MRLMPILTALIVALALYGMIMKRDELRAFAMTFSGDAEVDVAQEDDVEEAAPELEYDGPVPVSVVVMKSTAQQVQNGLVLSGRTEAARRVKLHAETSGLVISEPLAKGGSVNQGDVLCKLDPGIRNAQLAEAKAKLTSAEVNDTTATKLAERGFSSETAAISSHAALGSAQAAVEQVEKDIERLSIRAPFNGLLESDTAELGTLLGPATVCAELISLDPIRLVGYVPELDVDKLRLNGLAGGRLSSGREVRGEVTYISRSSDPLTRTFQIEVEVANADFSIRDGLSVEILIALDGQIGHFLPQSALTLNDEGHLGVRTNNNNTTEFMPVGVIRDDVDGIWVSGLPETAEIIVVGQEFVRAGREIKVTYREVDQ